MSDLFLRLRSALSIALVAGVLVACGSSDEVVEGCRNVPDFESNCKNSREWKPDWKEAEAAVVALPRDEDLVPIDAPNGAPGYEYAIDRATLRRGTDDVMRYTVMVRSATGAVNMFREGMRCETTQVRTYAYVSPGADAFRALEGDWGPLAARGARGYQDYLYEAIMCDRNGYAWAPERVVEALTAQYTAGGLRIKRYCGDLQDCSRTGKRL